MVRFCNSSFSVRNRWVNISVLTTSVGWKFILAHLGMTEERASACVNFFFILKELLDESFELWCVNCFLDCRGRNARKQTAGSHNFSCCFIRVFLLRSHHAPFWTTDVVLVCFVNSGTSTLILLMSFLCHTTSALPCSVLPGYSEAVGDHTPSATKEEMPCVKLLGFHQGHTT